MKFENIIVPTDFSNNASGAAPYAVELGKSFNAAVHLFHAFDAALYFTATAADTYAVLAATPTGWLATKYDADEFKLRKLAETLSGNGVVLRPVIRKGSPAHEIVAFANELAHPLIVVATQGRTGLSHLLLGSVAERVVRTSTCPVLTIPARKE
jgi:universal stress protein A